MDIFYNDSHNQIYNKLIIKVSKKTRENKIFLYIIACEYALYSNIDNIYNFECDELNLENIELVLSSSSKGEDVLLRVALHFFNWRCETPDLISIINSLDKKGYFVLRNAMDIYKEVIDI